jgi:pentatricopeptide repeat protein
MCNLSRIPTNNNNNNKKFGSQSAEMFRLGRISKNSPLFGFPSRAFVHTKSSHANQVRISQNGNIPRKREKESSFLSGKKLLKTLLLPLGYQVQPGDHSVFTFVHMGICDMIMKKCMEDGHTRLAFEIFKAVIDRGDIDIDEFFFHKGVSILHDLRDFDGAKMVFEVMILSGFIPREQTSIIFFESCKKSRDLSKVITILQEFKDRNIPIPAISYKYLIMSAANLGNDNLKKRFYSDLCDTALNSSPPDIKSVELVIQMAALVGDLDHAMKAFTILQSLGAPIKGLSYEYLIQTNLKYGKLETAQNLVKEIDDKRIEVSSRTLKILDSSGIKRSISSNIPEELQDYLQVVKSSMNCDHKDFERFEKIEAYWKNYKFDQAIQHLLDLIYSSNLTPSFKLMDELLRRLILSEKTDKVMEIFDYMKKVYTIQEFDGTSVCSDLMRFFSAQSKFDEVIQTYDFMTSIPSINHIWKFYVCKFTLVLSACRKSNQITRGLEIIEEMKRNSVKFEEGASQSALLLYIHANRCDDALHIFSRFLDNPLCETLQNPAFLGAMLKCLMENKRYDEAATFYVQMKELRAVRSIMVFTLSITLYRRLKDYEKAFEEYEEMLALGIRPSAQIYSAMFALCRDSSKAEEGERLYEEACEQNIQLNVKALTPLIQLRIMSRNYKAASDLLREIENNFPDVYANDMMIERVRNSLKNAK